jgi:hypothetical protein
VPLGLGADLWVMIVTSGMICLAISLQSLPVIVSTARQPARYLAVCNQTERLELSLRSFDGFR